MQQNNQERGWGIRALAERIDMSPSMVSRYMNETKEIQASMNFAVRVCRAFEVDITELYNLLTGIVIEPLIKEDIQPVFPSWTDIKLFMRLPEIQQISLLCKIANGLDYLQGFTEMEMRRLLLFGEIFQYTVVYPKAVLLQLPMIAEMGGALCFEEIGLYLRYKVVKGRGRYVVDWKNHHLAERLSSGTALYRMQSVKGAITLKLTDVVMIDQIFGFEGRLYLMYAEMYGFLHHIGSSPGTDIERLINVMIALCRCSYLRNSSEAMREKFGMFFVTE